LKLNKCPPRKLYWEELKKLRIKMEQIKKATTKTIIIEKDGVNFSVSFAITPDVLKHIDTYKEIITSVLDHLEELKKEIIAEYPLRFVVQPLAGEQPIGN